MSRKETVVPRVAHFMAANWPRVRVLLGHELERSCQLIAAYSRKIVTERNVNVVMLKFIKEFKSRLIAFRNQISMPESHRIKIRPVKYVLGASTVTFWKREGVTKDELKQTIDEFWKAFRASGGQIGPPKANANENGSKLDNNKNDEDDDCGDGSDDGSSEGKNEEEWEPIIVKNNFQVWRQAVPNSNLYRYKIFGSFDDVPARSFFAVQMDTEYRKTWDNLVIKLDVVTKEDKTKAAIESPKVFDSHSEVIHWVIRFPFPMYARDYCYVRRAIVDEKSNLMVMVSRAVDHPKCPEAPGYVRIRTYESNMVIKPHKSFDENGFDYMLTYFDDPKAAFPSMAYNWMACSGVPDFVKQLHAAAYELTVRNKSLSDKALSAKPSGSSSTSNSNQATNSNSNQTTGANYAYA